MCVYYNFWNLVEGISEGANASSDIDQVEVAIGVQGPTSVALPHWEQEMPKVEEL
jgi:hypothetical protein